MNINLPKDPLFTNGVSSAEFSTFLKNIRDAATTPRAPVGTTAERPTRYLEAGYTYFDTTLGKPIWVKSLSPVVWVDATGAVV